MTSSLFNQQISEQVSDQLFQSPSQQRTENSQLTHESAFYSPQKISMDVVISHSIDNQNGTDLRESLSNNRRINQNGIDQASIEEDEDDQAGLYRDKNLGTSEYMMGNQRERSRIFKGSYDMDDTEFSLCRNVLNQRPSSRTDTDVHVLQLTIGVKNQFFREIKPFLSLQAFKSILQNIQSVPSFPLTPIFNHLDRADQVYFILRGNVAILVPDQLDNNELQKQEYTSLLVRQTSEGFFQDLTAPNYNYHNKNVINKQTINSESSNQHRDYVQRLTELQTNINEMTVYDILTINFPNLTFVQEIGSGDYFGEVAIQFRTRRTATTIAMSDCVLAAIDWNIYNQYVAKRFFLSYNQPMKLMKKISLFEDFSQYSIYIMTKNVEVFQFKPQTTIYQSGQQADYIYFVKKGEIQIHQDMILDQKNNRIEDLDVEEEAEKDLWRKLNQQWKRREEKNNTFNIQISTLGAGNYFGEDGIVINRNRGLRLNTAVTTTICVIYRIERHIFWSNYRSLCEKEGISSNNKVQEDKEAWRKSQIYNQIKLYKDLQNDKANQQQNIIEDNNKKQKQNEKESLTKNGTLREFKNITLLRQTEKIIDKELTEMGIHFSLSENIQNNIIKNENTTNAGLNHSTAPYSNMNNAAQINLQSLHKQNSNNAPLQNDTPYNPVEELRKSIFLKAASNAVLNNMSNNTNNNNYNNKENQQSLPLRQRKRAITSGHQQNYQFDDRTITVYEQGKPLNGQGRKGSFQKDDILRISKENFHLPEYKIVKIQEKIVKLQQEQDQHFYSNDPLKIFDPKCKIYDNQLKLITRMHVMQKKREFGKSSQKRFQSSRANKSNSRLLVEGNYDKSINDEINIADDDFQYPQEYFDANTEQYVPLKIENQQSSSVGIRSSDQLKQSQAQLTINQQIGNNYMNQANPQFISPYLQRKQESQKQFMELQSISRMQYVNQIENLNFKKHSNGQQETSNYNYNKPYTNNAVDFASRMKRSRSASKSNFTLNNENLPISITQNFDRVQLFNTNHGLKNNRDPVDISINVKRIGSNTINPVSHMKYAGLTKQMGNTISDDNNQNTIGNLRQFKETREPEINLLRPFTSGIFNNQNKQFYAV